MLYSPVKINRFLQQHIAPNPEVTFQQAFGMLRLWVDERYISPRQASMAFSRLVMRMAQLGGIGAGARLCLHQVANLYTVFAEYRVDVRFAFANIFNGL